MTCEHVALLKIYIDPLKQLLLTLRVPLLNSSPIDGCPEPLVEGNIRTVYKEPWILLDAKKSKNMASTFVSNKSIENQN